MVAKHVSLVYEFKRQCETRLLLETSQAEQDLACNQDHSSAREVTIPSSSCYTHSIKEEYGAL